MNLEFLQTKKATSSDDEQDSDLPLRCAVADQDRVRRAGVSLVQHVLAISRAGERMNEEQRCGRWAWEFVTRHPHALTREIADATAEYSADDVAHALITLASLGYVARDAGSGKRGWVPLVRCVAVRR